MVEDFHLAASFDWETLAPVIFFILYGLAQLFGSKKKKPAGEDEEPEVDPAERARQIREEIRRRVEERRQEMEPGTTRPAHAPAQRTYDPTVPERQQQPAYPPVGQRTPPAQPVDASMDRQNSLQNQLIEQRRRLEESRKKQKAAHERAQRMMRQAGADAAAEVERKKHRHGKPGSSLVRKDLLRGLRSTAGLRKAVLYREILGSPLGLR